MKSPLNRNSLIFGSIILCLMVVDGLIQLRSIQVFNFNLFQQVNPDSAVAVFLLGLTLGMCAGIAFFFLHIRAREKSVDEETRQLDLLLEEISLSEEDDLSFTEEEFSEDSMVDEKAERSDPWERDADWWMNSDED